MARTHGTTSLALANLRTFVTLMVVAQHAMLAYHPYAPTPPASLAIEPRSWLAFPIVDTQRSTAFLVLTTFNDIFGMSLMFFLSGLFVAPSLERNGSRAYLRRRLARLGLPFLAAATVLTPLEYYPTYLATTTRPSMSGFVDEWMSMGLWPGAAGPAWFLWMLLTFDAVAVTLLGVIPRSRETLQRIGSDVGERPAGFFFGLVLVSAAAFVPLVAEFGPSTWSQWGPFKLQTSRVLHYLVYFLAGVAVGLDGLEKGLLAPTARLAARWREWTGIALLAYPLTVAIAAVVLAPGHSVLLWAPIGGVAFAVSCAASSWAVLAAFVRFGRVRGPILESLQRNAYGIYVVHYVFVTWLQYILLPAHLPAVAKGFVVFLGATALSWATTAALRRASVVSLSRIGP